MRKSRLLALIVDLSLISGLVLVIYKFNLIDLSRVYLLSAYPKMLHYPVLGIVFFFLYDFILTSLMSQTLGHNLFKLKVEFEHGGQYVRSVIKTLSLVTVFLAVYSFVLIDKQQSFHDQIARSRIWKS